MASLQRRTHDTNVTRAVESEVASTVRHLNQLLLDALVLQVRRVDEVRGAELLGPLLLARVQVDNNDLASFSCHSSLHDGETDTAGSEDSNVVALGDLRGLDGGTVTGGDTAAKQTGAVHGGILGDGDDGDVRDDGVLGEGGGAHEVEEILALALESGGAVGHHTSALCRSDLAAEVGLSGLAELALSTLRGTRILSVTSTPWSNPGVRIL